MITRSEWTRKLLHVSMGAFALALRWLTWREATLCAAAALGFNAFVMPRFGKRLYRDAARHRDPGMIAYPAMVLALILLCRHDLALAAAVWGMMALGDPAASIAGKLIGGPKLPWNRQKSWIGFLAYAVIGGIAARLLCEFAGDGGRWGMIARESPWIFFAGSVAGALLESLETGLDDNWIPPIPVALLMYSIPISLLAPSLWPSLTGWPLALAVNLAIAAVAGGLKIVSRSGAIAGAVVGFLILAFAGWGAYAVLWTFFAAGTLATKLGFRTKLARGTAQKREGRRGAEHVVANCGVPLVLAAMAHAALPGVSRLLVIGFAGAFAAALADTFGTEFGSLYGRRAYSLVAWKEVPPGTKGAISSPGTLAGVFGGLLIGGVAAATGLISWHWTGVIAVAGIGGSIAESLMLDAAARRGHILDHEFVNAFNTFVGAVVAVEIAVCLLSGSTVIPLPPMGNI